MAMACFRLVTFLPLRPDLSLPCFIARISRSTSLPAEGEYFRPEDFLAALFRDEALLRERLELFFAALLRELVLLRALLFFADDFFALDFFALDFFALDFFFVDDFLVAMR
jgi:hypothetical protein